MEFNERLKSGKKREKHILKELKKMGLLVDIYENNTFDNFGRPKINQDIFVNNKKLKCPDVQIFNGDGKTSVIFRVEVKSFSSGTDWYSKQFNNIPVVGIETNLYNSYLALRHLDEINCMVIFVLGDVGKYEYYWEYLGNLDTIKHKEGKLFSQTFDDGTFWRISDLKHELKSFLSEVQNCVNNY